MNKIIFLIFIILKINIINIRFHKQTYLSYEIKKENLNFFNKLIIVYINLQDFKKKIIIIFNY